MLPLRVRPCSRNPDAGSKLFKARDRASTLADAISLRHHESNFSSGVMKSSDEPSIEDEAGGHARTYCEVRKRLASDAGAVMILCQRGRIHVVLEADRNSEMSFQHIRKAHIRPVVEIRGHVHGAGFMMHDAGGRASYHRKGRVFQIRISEALAHLVRKPPYQPLRPISQRGIDRTPKENIVRIIDTSQGEAYIRAPDINPRNHICRGSLLHFPTNWGPREPSQAQNRIS